MKRVILIMIATTMFSGVMLFGAGADDGASVVTVGVIRLRCL